MLNLLKIQGYKQLTTGCNALTTTGYSPCQTSTKKGTGCVEGVGSSISYLLVITFNFLVAVLCTVAIRKNSQRKKKLKAAQLLFEG